jgi:isoquinoline 1-oxidoreductase alpha subunit
MVTLNINDKDYLVEAEPDELLVWVIHEKVGLTKTRFGCGIQMCGSCKVLINGEMKYTCNLKVAEILGQKITTREGLPDDHPLVTGVDPKQVN